jgi:hypothetical protein
LTTDTGSCQSPGGQAGADFLIPEEGRIRRDALGPLEVTEAGLRAAANFALKSGVVPSHLPQWEVLEFLQDILARIRAEVANRDETR